MLLMMVTKLKTKEPTKRKTIRHFEKKIIINLQTYHVIFNRIVNYYVNQLRMNPFFTANYYK